MVGQLTLVVQCTMHRKLDFKGSMTESVTTMKDTVSSCIAQIISFQLVSLPFSITSKLTKRLFVAAYSMHWQPSKLLQTLATHDVPMRRWGQYMPAAAAAKL